MAIGWRCNEPARYSLGESKSKSKVRPKVRRRQCNLQEKLQSLEAKLSDDEPKQLKSVGLGDFGVSPAFMFNTCD